MCACTGTKKVVTVGIAADSRLSVGLDPASDGLGGVDHEVLLDGELGMNIQITDKIKVRYCGDARVDPGLAPAGFDTMRSQEAAFRFKHSSVQAHDRLLHLLHALKLTVRSTFVKIASAGQLANQGGRGGALEGYKCRQI